MDKKRKLVAEVIDTLKPAMEVDGGGIEDFIVEQNNVIKVKFKGTCIFCPSQNLTLRLGLRKTILEKLDWVVDVIAYK